MGTRGLTSVILDAETKIAQYGQWDHYPAGQGVTILNFLRHNDLEKFKDKLRKQVRFQTEQDEKEIQDFLEEIGCPNGWMDTEQSKKYKERFPYLTRDHGAGILQLVADSKEDEDIALTDSSSFVEDGLFCEWYYILDLDKETLEVGGGASRVYDINNLPTDGEFIDELEIIYNEEYDD